MREGQGITNEEAGRRLKLYGPNELREFSSSSPSKIFLRQVKNNFLIYLLSFAAVLSFFVGKVITAYTILFVIGVIIVTGFIQEYKAEKAIQALRKMIMPVSIVIREGKEREVPSSQIVPGDIILLRSGEKIPADCLLLEQHELLVNESSLTGESKEVKKSVSGQEKHSDENMVFAGTFVVNGRCRGMVLHTSMDTRFGKISGMISSADKVLPLQKKVNGIAKYLAMAAIFFSVLTGTLMIITAPEVSPELYIEVLILVIAFSVAAFPEGLPVVLTTCLAFGAHKMAAKNAIVNRMSVIETLGETTAICSDKTGTITRGEMTACRVFADDALIEIKGAGYEASGDFLHEGRKISPANNPVLGLLLKSSVICNDSRIERTGEGMEFRTFGSPTESALLIMAAKAGIFREDIHSKRIEEMPFNSERKMMSVRCEIDSGHTIYSKGAPEVLLARCKFIQRREGVTELTERERKKISAASVSMSADALRTIAVASGKSDSKGKGIYEQDLVFLGLVGMRDPPREEVKEAIKTCIGAGIKVKMITGDNLETAVSVAREVGLVGRAMVGDELDQLTDHELSKVVKGIVVFARVKPEHKLRIVKALKANGEIVTMTGDGVNDAPALREAHIGVAMGRNGTDVCRSVADLTLKDDNFATIVVAVREGRAIFKNIRKFTSYLLSCKYAEITILVLGVVLAPILGWQVPFLLALQILFMNLVTDDLPAIMLSLNPSSSTIMTEKPRKNEGILTRPIMVWSLIAGLFMAFATLSVFFVSYNIFDMGIEYSRTMALATLIGVELAGAYNFLSYRKALSLKLLKSNKYLSYASAISVAATMAIIYTPLNSIFGTVPLGIQDWATLVLISVSIILVFNLLKKLNNEKGFLNLDARMKDN